MLLSHIFIAHSHCNMQLGKLEIELFYIFFYGLAISQRSRNSWIIFENTDSLAPYPFVFVIARWQHSVFVSFFVRWCLSQARFSIKFCRTVGRWEWRSALMPCTCTVIQARRLFAWRTHTLTVSGNWLTKEEEMELRFYGCGTVNCQSQWKWNKLRR